MPSSLQRGQKVRGNDLVWISHSPTYPHFHCQHIQLPYIWGMEKMNIEIEGINIELEPAWNEMQIKYICRAVWQNIERVWLMKYDYELGRLTIVNKNKLPGHILCLESRIGYWLEN